MLWLPPVELSLIASNVPDGTRPAATNGTSITPAQNGLTQAYTEIIAAGSITDDIYWVELIFHDWNLTTVARDAIAEIGLGGTQWIPPLIMSQAGTLLGVSGSGSPVTYGFPLFGAAGQAVACRVSVNSATLTAGYVICNLYGRPSGPVKVGSFVRSFGVDLTNSRGTLITPGTTSEGSYTQLGSALNEDLWYWEFGSGVNDAAIQQSALFADIAVGDATNKKVVIRDGYVQMGVTEAISKPEGGRYAIGKSGDLVYGRGQYGSGADTDTSLAAYGVGG